MYKFLFELIVEPLGLPIYFIYEYMILLIISEFAFHIAWDATPGGKWGSEIHWFVRVISFLVIWFLTYSVILVLKWIISNWVLLLGGAIAFILIFFLMTMIKRSIYDN